MTLPHLYIAARRIAFCPMRSVKPSNDAGVGDAIPGRVGRTPNLMISPLHGAFNAQ